MYIGIILEHKNIASPKEALIECTWREGNVDYLVKGENNPAFPYLAEVEMDDYSTFDFTDMDGIIEELLRVRAEVTDPADKAHIDDIIRLARKCKEMPDTVLTFAG